ncbi:MAG: hypothetical protein IT360_27175 [Gemmatimonadaceae bacterium]|nr:hypothetical protein [Gemmatimonadaceae bacterium]
MSRRWSLLAGLIATASAVSCIELSVDPTAVGSIEFLAPSSPSIIRRDTLRDSTGAPERLRARVFSTGGDELTDIEVSFVNTDSLVIIEDGNLVVSTRDTSGTARIYASAAGLQSVVRTFEIISRPDSIAASVAEDTVRYRVPTTGVLDDTSTAISFVVRSGSATVGGVRVTFQLLRGGEALAAGDTGTYALVRQGGRVSFVDTTDASGVAQRTFRLRTVVGTVLRDTIVVRADVSLGGPPLKGSPALMQLVILPTS